MLFQFFLLISIQPGLLIINVNESVSSSGFFGEGYSGQNYSGQNFSGRNYSGRDYFGYDDLYNNFITIVNCTLNCFVLNDSNVNDVTKVVELLPSDGINAKPLMSCLSGCFLELSQRINIDDDFSERGYSGIEDDLDPFKTVINCTKNCMMMIGSIMNDVTNAPNDVSNNLEDIEVIASCLSNCTQVSSVESLTTLSTQATTLTTTATPTTSTMIPKTTSIANTTPTATSTKTIMTSTTNTTPTTITTPTISTTNTTPTTSTTTTKTSTATTISTTSRITATSLTASTTLITSKIENTMPTKTQILATQKTPITPTFKMQTASITTKTATAPMIVMTQEISTISNTTLTTKSTGPKTSMALTTLKTTSETLPTTSETPLTTSETLPTTSETPRTTSETLPIISKTPRTTSETLPTTSETPRTTSETLPTTSETPLTTSETLPTTSETPRTTSETLPIISETPRTTLKTSRKATPVVKSSTTATTSSTTTTTTTTTVPNEVQINQTKILIEDFLNDTNLSNVSESDLENLSGNLNSLIERIDMLPPGSLPSSQTSGVALVFPEILRKVIFTPNSTRKIQIETENFEVQVALVETSTSFTYKSTDEDKESILIPSSVLNQVANTESSGNSVIVVVVRYSDDTLFPSDENVSEIYSIDIGTNSNQTLSNLQEPIQITFSEPVQTQNISIGNFVCVYWNFEQSDWLTDGCALTLQSPPTCECSHTTNFALLIKPNLPDDIVLNIVSTVGFILSIVGLLLTLITHIIFNGLIIIIISKPVIGDALCVDECKIIFMFKELRKRRPSIILMHICFNLCVGYIIFLVGVEHAKWNKELCIATAFFLHVFFLAAWGWMTIYSYDLYLSIVKIFHNKKSFFMRKFGGISYCMAVIIPVITVAVSLATDENTTDYPNYLASNVCWLAQSPLLYSFLLPIAIMLCFNQTVFVLVFKDLFGKSSKKALSSAQKRTAEQQFIVSVTMVCFTGLAWIFAFLLLVSELFESSGYETLFSWLFVVFNTLQGLGIFILTTLKSTVARRLWRRSIRERFTGPSSTLLTSSSGRSYSKRSVLMKNSTKLTTVDNIIKGNQEKSKFALNSSI